MRTTTHFELRSPPLRNAGTSRTAALYDVLIFHSEAHTDPAQA